MHQLRASDGSEDQQCGAFDPSVPECFMKGLFTDKTKRRKETLRHPGQL